MKKRKKKAAWVVAPPVLALTLIAGSSGMGQGSVFAAPEETETNEEDPKKCIVGPYSTGVDLKGRDVRIVNWYEGEPKEPSNQYEKDRLDYYDDIQKTFHFTIHTDNIGGWGESYTTQLSSSITAGDPIGQICTLDASWFPSLFNNWMMAPLDPLSNLDFREEKWNQGVLEATSVGGHVYGMAVGHEPRYGIFYNKRLLQEAGYGAETLYDLQKNGTWTWSKFEEVLRACTRDTDHDGDIDTWGMVGYNYDYFQAAIYSSGTDLLTKDTEGHFINQMGTKGFLDALNWANNMWQKYAEPQPNGSDWDYFKDCFTRGEAAMRVTEEYAKADLWTMSDEWGFVMFPCPDGQEPVATEREQVLFIPSSYSHDEANEIAFAFDLYTDPVPGYEDGDAWKEEYYPAYKDTRAVDETLNRMKSGKTRQRLDLYVSGLEDVLGSGFIWDIAAGAVTPQEAIQSQMPALNAVIREQNDCLSRVYGISLLETEPEDPKPERQNISLGIGEIGSPDDPTEFHTKWEGDFVYFGKYDGLPVKYRVLDPTTEIYGGRTMLLDCDEILYMAPFDADGKVNEGASQLNDWRYSDLRAGLNGEAFLLKPNVFSEAERNAIASSVIAAHDREPELGDTFEAYSALIGEKIFLLDIEDIRNRSYGYDPESWLDDSRRKYMILAGGTASSWWIRSASAESKAASGYVDTDGDVFSHFERIGMQRGVSPALNLDLSYVLFSSLASVDNSGHGAYKLTLLDDEIRLHVLEDPGVVRSGNTLTLSYSVAGKHTPNRLSVLVLDKEYTRGNSDAKILQYEDLDVDGSINDGTLTIVLAPDLGEDYFVYLVAQDVHGQFESDYASMPVEIFPFAAYSETESTEPETTTEEPTEALTEAPTEEPTEKPTEALTEAPMEAQTEVSTEPTEAGSEDKQDGTLAAPTDAASDTKGNNVWPFVICGAVILLGAAGAVVIKRNRNRKA